MTKIVQFPGQEPASAPATDYPHFAGSPVKPRIPRAHTHVRDAREGNPIPIDARTERELMLWNAYVSALTVANRTLKFEHGRAAAKAFQAFTQLFCSPEA